MLVCQRLMTVSKEVEIHWTTVTKPLYILLMSSTVSCWWELFQTPNLYNTHTHTWFSTAPHMRLVYILSPHSALSQHAGSPWKIIWIMDCDRNKEACSSLCCSPKVRSGLSPTYTKEALRTGRLSNWLCIWFCAILRNILHCREIELFTQATHI